MEIDPNSVYTVKEASELFGVNRRKLTRLAKKYDVKIIDNRYIFEGAFLLKHLSPGEVRTVSQDVPKLSQDVLGQEKILSLEKEIADLKKTDQDLRLKIKQLQEDLSTYEVGDNERIEVFTYQEYEIFEQRLREWYTMQKDLQHQEEVFNAETKSLNELLTHYQNQYEYQRKQSERILDMHQQLIDNIQKQNVIQLQRQTIEAKEKGIN